LTASFVLSLQIAMFCASPPRKPVSLVRKRTTGQRSIPSGSWPLTDFSVSNSLNLSI